MECQKLIDLLVDYVDEELNEEQRLHLEEHLGKCPPCEEFLDSYRRAGTACREALKAKMPDRVKSGLSDFLREQLHSQKS